jgi:secreted Zn-dependent insulinase-like peptidase
MNPGHPASTFAVGNLETLADRPDSDVRQELIRFYERYYSANLMTLTVVGRESLDELETIVREQFSGIENRNVSGLDVPLPLYEPDSLPARLDVVPKRESFSLSFRFPIPPVRPHWRSKPSVHLSHLLGHEGETSLLAQLKRAGWAQGLSAGTGFSDRHGATMDVNIQLTPQGAEHVDEIARALFAYVDVIRRDGLERWLFDENARLAKIDFRFSEKAAPIALARGLSSLQHEIPQHEVLRASSAYDEWRPDLMRNIVEALRPDNLLLTRVAPGLETDSKAPWYDTPFKVTPIDSQTIARWKEPPADVSTLAMPAPNPFIPEDLQMVAGTGSSAPTERPGKPGYRLWHLADDKFALPKADFFFSMRSPVANDTPRHSVLTQLYVSLVNDALDAFAYPADLAGLSFRLYTHSRGISVRISGYDDRQAVLLDRILGGLTAGQVDPARFAIIKAETKRSLENSRRNQPYSRAMGRLRDLVMEPNWTLAERLAVIDSITAPQVEAHARKLRSRVQVVALAHGNLDVNDADALGDKVHAALVEPATPVEVPRGRIVRLRRGDRLGHALSVEHPESGLVSYYQAGDRRLETRAMAGLTAQILSSPFFDALRTEKKLGYVVFANAFPILDTAGLVFIVQSPVASANTLHDEVRGFLADYAAQIKAMDEATFTQHKQALVSRVMEEERQLSERSSRFWEEIDRDNSAFDTREQITSVINVTSLEDFQRFYDRVLVSPARRELAVRAHGQGTPPVEDPLAGEQPVNAPWVRLNRGLLPG